MFSKRLVLHKYAIEELRKAGCTVDDIDNEIAYIKYYIHSKEDKNKTFKLKYTYHSTNQGVFFLDRIKPYNLPIGEFTSEERIVAFILKDIQLFDNAVNSTNFAEFIELGKNIEKFKHTYEKFFLHKNVQSGDLNYISQEIQLITTKLQELGEQRKSVIVDK